jgi:hypothetical protein
MAMVCVLLMATFGDRQNAPHPFKIHQTGTPWQRNAESLAKKSANPLLCLRGESA